MSEFGKWQKVQTPDTAGCFIQWKGTDVCIDLHCTCGSRIHFDGDFLYAWECPKCKKIWEMGYEVKMREVETHDIIQYPQSE